MQRMSTAAHHQVLSDATRRWASYSYAPCTRCGRPLNSYTKRPLCGPCQADALSEALKQEAFREKEEKVERKLRESERKRRRQVAKSLDDILSQTADSRPEPSEG